MRIGRAFIEITRLDSALLAFLSVFVPYLSRTGDAAFSAGQALPILLTCMSTFAANDIDDVTKDEINHPHRPLPSRRLGSGVATAIYFGCLIASLYATKYFVNERLAFWYYSLIVLSTSYGYVVDSLPSLKGVYVALCTSVPIVIVAMVYPTERSLLLIAAAAFLSTVGREACMDIRDRPGDGSSWMDRFSLTTIAALATAFQGTAVAMFAFLVQTSLEIVTWTCMVLALSAACIYWFRYGRTRISIALMKLEFVLGLVFLI